MTIEEAVVTLDVIPDILEEKMSKLTERQKKIYERMVAIGKHDVLETSVTLAAIWD